MVYCFDIDGTLCTNTDGAYDEAVPLPDVIALVNGLHAEGHRILLYTARGATTGIDWRGLTEQQMASWGVAVPPALPGQADRGSLYRRPGDQRRRLAAATAREP